VHSSALGANPNSTVPGNKSTYGYNIAMPKTFRSEPWSAVLEPSSDVAFSWVIDIAFKTEKSF
jgi:hypothetical protein